MNADLTASLFEETIALAEEEGYTTTVSRFRDFVCEILPLDILQELEDITGGGATFLEDLWQERFMPDEPQEQTDCELVDQYAQELEDDCCVVCERKVRLTRHHVFPREEHKSLSKKGYDNVSLQLTIQVCRMCHSTIHRLFTNSQLASDYYSVDLLLSDERFVRYAKWASIQSNRRYNKI
jgi:hypothetical protein